MTAQRTTLEVVQQMLMEQFDLTTEQVVPDGKLADLGVDSLATIEFLFNLEERFGLDMNNEPAPIETVGQIAEEIDRLLARKAEAPVA
ncbi:MAG: phosphopantetheine-binding protein [Burkholderiales bacterium]